MVSARLRWLMARLPGEAYVHDSRRRDELEGTPMSGATLVLAERLGTEPVVFPGDHGGFAVQPEAFAAKLHEVLARL
jgi:hypothetical protein